MTKRSWKFNFGGTGVWFLKRDFAIVIGLKFSQDYVKNNVNISVQGITKNNILAQFMKNTTSINKDECKASFLGWPVR